MNNVDFKIDIAPLHITDREFMLISSLIRDNFGIDLSEQKKAFVVNRLQKMLRVEGFRSFESYYHKVVADNTKKELSRLASFVTTNYTFFNRESAHFDFFVKEILPSITKRLKVHNSNDIRVWSAGCSTGEEPYMLAMLMLEYFGNESFLWDAGVLATDISYHVLEIAKAGIYSQEQVIRIPDNLRSKYFNQTGDGEWLIKNQVKKEVTFRKFNLMSKDFLFKKPFHAIFCRNVMIYFDEPTRYELVRRFYRMTQPGGYLFIGHSESLSKKNCDYKYVMPSIYKKE